MDKLEACPTPAAQIDKGEVKLVDGNPVLGIFEKVFARIRRKF